MASDENTLSIRSRHGLLRDLIPIYSLYQLAPNLIAISLILWLSVSIGYFPKMMMPVVMLGWVFQFVARPSVMTISNTQAAWLELALGDQGFYEWSDVDGRWRLLDQQWWQRLPHLFIELIPEDSMTVKVIAPHYVMESLRASLELLEEHKILIPQGSQPFSFEPAESVKLPWHMQLPAAVLGAACVVAWVWFIFKKGSAGMVDWGVSGLALSQGRFDTIVLHMFAHGGLTHLIMNMSVLAAIGGPLSARLGSAPHNWLRFLLLYFLSGLAGAALYVAIHPAGTVPMVGASGALYGLFGLTVRAPATSAGVLSVKSMKIRRVSWDLVKQNAFLFALLWALAWASGTAGGLAWESHLGGFLFGLLAGPKLLPRLSESTSDIETSREPIAHILAPTD